MGKKWTLIETSFYQTIVCSSDMVYLQIYDVLMLCRWKMDDIEIGIETLFECELSSNNNWETLSFVCFIFCSWLSTNKWLLRPCSSCTTCIRVDIWPIDKCTNMHEHLSPRLLNSLPVVWYIPTLCICCSKRTSNLSQSNVQQKCQNLRKNCHHVRDVLVTQAKCSRCLT